MAIYPAASTLSLMMFEEFINICSSTLSMPDCLIYRINKFRLLLLSRSTRHIYSYSMHEAEKGDENGKCLHAEWFVNRKTHISSFCSFPSRGTELRRGKFSFHLPLFLCCCCFLFTFHKILTLLLLLNAWMVSMKILEQRKRVRNSIHIFLEPEQLSHITIYRIFLSGICVLAVELYPNMCKTRKGIIERWWWHNTAKKKEKRIHIVQCLFVQIQHLFVWVKQQIYFVILFLPFPSPELTHPVPPPLALSCVYDISIFSTAVCCPNDNKQKWTFQFVGGRAFRVSSQGKIHLTHTTLRSPPSDIDKRRTNDDKGIGKSERECGKRKGKYFCWCLCVLDFSPFSDEWRENEELVEGTGERAKQKGSENVFELKREAQGRRGKQ